MTGTTSQGGGVRISVPEPQWSPVLMTGTTIADRERVRAAADAAMEPRADDGDDRSLCGKHYMRAKRRNGAPC